MTTAISQVLMIFLAAFALILLLFIFRSLWTIVTVKYKSHNINKRLNTFPNSNPGTATVNELRNRPVPTISSQLQISTREANGIHPIATTSNPHRQTYPRSAVLSHNQNNLNNRMRPSRLEAVAQRHQRNPGQHCQCSSHRHSNLNAGVPNQSSSNGQQIIKILVFDEPPTYDEATMPPTFEESQLMESKIHAMKITDTDDTNKDEANTKIYFQG